MNNEVNVINNKLNECAKCKNQYGQIYRKGKPGRRKIQEGKRNLNVKVYVEERYKKEDGDTKRARYMQRKDASTRNVNSHCKKWGVHSTPNGCADTPKSKSVAHHIHYYIALKLKKYTFQV